MHQFQISTCVGFQALAKATTQNTRGLRYTGVAGAMCGRSEMILPQCNGKFAEGREASVIKFGVKSVI